MCNGRAVQGGLCMKPLSQRDATVMESLCQVSRNLSQEAAAGWNLTAGVSLWGLSFGSDKPQDMSAA